MEIQDALDFYTKIAQKSNAKLVAVSKTKPIESIQEAYSNGQRIFGENKVQELTEKQEQLPTDIEWHMIGHLQSNKVKYIAPFVTLIHAVDSYKLLKEINKQAARNNRIISVLLQAKIASEESKFGLSEAEIVQILEDMSALPLQHIQIVGLMGMATNTKDKEVVRKEFSQLANLKSSISKSYQLPNLNLVELSIGMSSDYQLALEEGSTMIRIGSAIFGKREYPNG
jgi:pyridoxal phosphate enzyme (YggS family)